MKKAFCSLAIMVLLSSCKKNKSDCETWEYFDDCTCLNTGIFGCGFNGCVDGPVLQGKFCGDELITIHADSSKLLSQDSNSKTIRRFLRKIN